MARDHVDGILLLWTQQAQGNHRNGNRGEWRASNECYNAQTHTLGNQECSNLAAACTTTAEKGDSICLMINEDTCHEAHEYEDKSDDLQDEYGSWNTKNVDTIEILFQY